MVEKERHNGPERDFELLASVHGWNPCKRGWPDFMCLDNRTGEVIAVEVKPRIGDGSRMRVLKREQAKCMDWLSAHGIRCFVSDGETLEPYSREKHAAEKFRREAKARRAKLRVLPAR